MTDHLKGDDFEDMEAWREWASSQPSMSQLHSDLLGWWSKGQRMSTDLNNFMGLCDDQLAEIAKLRADLTEALWFIQVTAEKGAFPSQINDDARAFLNKHNL